MAIIETINKATSATVPAFRLSKRNAMAKTTSTLALAHIVLDRRSTIPLYRQLYNALREAMLTGRLRAGTRLPSTRTLAQELGLSRITVTDAFDQLFSEGCLEGKVGSGTYVAYGRNGRVLGRLADQKPTPRVPQRARLLSLRGKRMGKSLANYPTWVSSTESFAFQPNVPAVDEFPFRIWERLLARRWRLASPTLFAQRDVRDYFPLQKALAEYLRTTRGAQCEPEQVIMTTGSQQALDLISRLLVDRGDAVWIEEPAYLGARNALLAAGARLVPVPVDREGIKVEEGLRRCPQARLAYVSPSHQYPLGATLSLTRRLQLLDWARRANAWILEDDYDSEYRYVGWPLAALQGLDRHGRVIYLGTLSKVLLPAIRLGYMIVPPDLVDALVATRLVAGRMPSVEQAVLADFIAEGHFARHIRRMRHLYAERQQALMEAIERDLNGILEVQPAEGGMHIVAWLPPDVDDQVTSRLASAQGVGCPPLSLYYIGKPKRGGLVLGYGACNERVIGEGTRRMAEALRTPALRTAKP
jgi:GntR family transcriptional regulator/MocR family aminotransferase